VNPPLDHRDIEELLGAYALDAVDADERDLIERHLADCPRCRAEVAEHREVAAFLAHTGAPAPDGVWDRIAGSLEEPPPVLQLERVRERRRSVPLRAVGIAAAAAVAVIVGLGGFVIHQDRRLDEMNAALRKNAIAQAAALADGEQVTLRAPEGALRVRAVMAPASTSYLYATGLPRLPDDRTYQLWGFVDGTPVSLAVLGAKPTIVPFHAGREVTVLAITEEQAGGVVRSDHPPVVLADV
jgi:anti-sigma-K factor RskA